MTLSAVFEGNAPADFTAAEAWFGKAFNGVSVFTGQSDWSNYDSSVGWEIALWAGAAAQTFWSIPLMANGANLHDAGTGAYDSHYVAAARQLAAATGGTGPIYIRTGWEFNGNWEIWSAQNDPADYVAAFQQFVTSYRSVSSRFIFVWTPQIGAAGMADPTLAYPGDKYVDLIGEDFYYNKTYNTSGALADWNYFVSEPYGLQWQQDFAAAHGKGTATPEWGVDVADSATFIQLATNWFVSHHEVYASYWDSNAKFDGKLSGGNLPTAGTAFKTDVAAMMSGLVVKTVTSDFDGDGKADVLWHNSNGQTGLWESTHGTGVGSYVVLDTVGSDWSIAGTGDFDGDFKTDIIWRNATGGIALWDSSLGLNSSHYLSLGSMTTDYQIAGVGDFDGDHKADVLWRNIKTGDVGLWQSSLGLNSGPYQDLGVVGPNATIVGVGDFDGDGKSDILWRDSVTGEVGEWLSSRGLGSSHYVTVNSVPLDWVITGLGDFDGDGKTDVLWRNTNGEIGLWETSRGAGVAGFVDLGYADPSWRVIAVGDYDGDGRADILWRNTTTSETGMWESSHGLDVAHFLPLGTFAAPYTAVNLMDA